MLDTINISKKSIAMMNLQMVKTILNRIIFDAYKKFNLGKDNSQFVKAGSLRRVHGMPYVRKEYIRGIKPVRIMKFEMGKLREGYDTRVIIKAAKRAQIRDNALEAARVTANRVLRKLGADNYYLKVHVYPHQILRENKMLVGAHADRLQKGMSRAFGKVIGRASRVKVGQVLMSACVKREGLRTAKRALKVASQKFPIPCIMEVVEVVGD